MESESVDLLRREWSPEDVCPSCLGVRPRHKVGCIIDLALAERGFADQKNRDGARRCLELSRQSTIPAPKPDP